MKLVVALGADHGGFSLKTDLIPWLESQGRRVVDVGAYSLGTADDYPDFAEAVAHGVTSGQAERSKQGPWDSGLPLPRHLLRPPGSRA